MTDTTNETILSKSPFFLSGRILVFIWPLLINFKLIELSLFCTFLLNMFPSPYDIVLLNEWIVG